MSGYPYGYGTTPGYGYSSYPGSYYSYPGGSTALGTNQYGQQSGVTQAMYMPGNAPARVTVIVPTPDAQVFFGDTPTRQTGTTVREFVSPPLEPGKQFQYELRAQWKQGDQTMDQKQTVDVQAGGRAVANFAQQQGTTPQNTQQLNPPTNTRPRKDENP